MLSEENSTENLTLQPSTPLGKESVLLSKVAAQQEKTATFGRKLWEFFKISVLHYPSDFEHYVRDVEPNDCTFVAKYSKVVTVDLRHCAKLSVDNVTLHGLHAVHPLINFAKEEPLAPEMLKEVDESPALMFIHGLGGQMSQFEPVMSLLAQCLEIYALDLPGFGDSRMDFSGTKSSFSEEEKQKISSSVRAMSWDDFATENIVTIIVEFILQHIPPNKKIMLFGHSMGTHLLIKVATRLEKQKVEGLVLLSPPSLINDVSGEEAVKGGLSVFGMMRLFTYFPFLMNLFRVWDRLEGLLSKSVLRQVPKDSSIYVKLRQFRWNLDVDTNVVLRYANGFAKATYSDIVTAISNFNNVSSDTRIYEKTVLLGGLEDHVTPIKVLEDVHSFLLEYFQREVSKVTEVKNAGHSLLLLKPEFISGMILNHLELYFPERLHLSPAWVLKLKADISGDKWGLKNELKWLQTQGISFNIVRKNSKNWMAPLIGMKTLREGDSVHSPAKVEDIFYGAGATNGEKQVSGNLIAIVDISADIPPYSPKALKHIKYYKCATVSKVVPDHIAIRRFIQLIDDILSSNTVENPLIAVHCHYGFNRTGFLICCYAVERLGWSVKEAVEGFKNAKPPGIKHRHFIDALYVRYES
ncbi:CIC11C00000005056 [Sungouiella intermedia]|uniref:CIC11C00000005056 n=1 Tax=Sungouiella intermedia TaxID=45354 RepID=A0A1L0D1B4_9ASCO|nr:CIC11C00000005056 [[Candida] intermedia]